MCILRRTFNYIQIKLKHKERLYHFDFPEALSAALSDSVRSRKLEMSFKLEHPWFIQVPFKAFLIANV